MKWTTAPALLATALLLASCQAPPASTPTATGDGAKPAKANPVIVVVDLEHLVEASDFSKRLNDELKGWAEAKQGELAAHAQRLQQSHSTPPKPAEVEALRREMFGLQERAKQEFQQRQGEAGERMRATLDPLLKDLAAANGWDVVLNKNEQITVFAGDALDQTDFVLARLNAASTASTTP